MATTSPDNLRTPNPTDPYNLVADLAILAGDVQSALNFRANSFRGTSAQRLAFTSAPDGAHWFDTTESREYVRIGAEWKPGYDVSGGANWFDIPPSAGFSVASGGYLRGRIQNGLFSLSINRVDRNSGSGQATLVDIGPWCQPGVDVPVTTFTESGSVTPATLGATGLLRAAFSTSQTYRASIFSIPI